MTISAELDTCVCNESTIWNAAYKVKSRNSELFTNSFGSLVVNLYVHKHVEENIDHKTLPSLNIHIACDNANKQETKTRDASFVFMINGFEQALSKASQF